MKKMSLLLLLGIFSLSFMVKAGMPDYVITGDGVQYFKNLHYGIKNFLVGKDESGKVCYQADEVVVYRKDGHVYEKMPVICDGKETGCYSFMELVAYRNGLKVFRHSSYWGCNIARQDEYIVYKNGCYHLSFDEENFKILSKFFLGHQSLYHKMI